MKNKRRNRFRFSFLFNCRSVFSFFFVVRFIVFSAMNFEYLCGFFLSLLLIASDWDCHLYFYFVVLGVAVNLIFSIFVWHKFLNNFDDERLIFIFNFHKSHAVFGHLFSFSNVLFSFLISLMHNFHPFVHNFYFFCCCQSSLHFKKKKKVFVAFQLIHVPRSDLKIRYRCACAL